MKITLKNYISFSVMNRNQAIGIVLFNKDYSIIIIVLILCVSKSIGRSTKRVLPKYVFSEKRLILEAHDIIVYNL